MKKIFVGVIVLLLSKSGFSQPGPPKPPPPEERWQHDSKKINEAVGLSQAQLDKLKAVFMDFYKDMDQVKDKMQPPPPPPPQPSKEEMDKIVGKRNESLKKIMSAEQFQKFSEVDKQLGPPKHGQPPVPPQKTSPTK